MVRFQQLRPDQYTLQVQVATHRDNFTHTITYSSLDEAHANHQQDVADITRLAHLRAEYQDAMDKLPGLHEHTAHLDAQQKRIIVSLVSHVPEGTANDEQYPCTQLPAELHELADIHARHLDHVVKHKASLAERAVKFEKLKGLK